MEIDNRLVDYIVMQSDFYTKLFLSIKNGEMISYFDEFILKKYICWLIIPMLAYHSQGFRYLVRAKGIAKIDIYIFFKLNWNKNEDEFHIEFPDVFWS